MNHRIHRPLVISIGGGTGSGKTTLTGRLEADLHMYNVRVLHTDRYYVRHRPKGTAPFSGKEYEDFNHPAAVDLTRIIADLTRIANDGETEVVMVEGFLALYFPVLREWTDLKLYVECQSDERLARRIQRFSQEGYNYEEIVTEYLDFVRYRHDEFVEPTKWYADLIVNGSGSIATGYRLLLSMIRQELRERKELRL
ncbi:uridine kinase family protein [Paenibacillus spongiae]|uniref:AAA family ATPase n=1 Tax=Paenibacillus spongiae TaxID=2909671 RepID=A0ABY5S4Z8_9BACL|nr:AAA family ATPase [Paenibacillus spongiae]UVI28974.1 AAA family ATPase [Paenibacillus spongiae]